MPYLILPIDHEGIRKDIQIIYWRKRWFDGEFLLEDALLL